jgi:hypothetical protein
MGFSVYVKRDIDGTIIDKRYLFDTDGEVKAQRQIEDMLPGKLVRFMVSGCG